MNWLVQSSNGSVTRVIPQESFLGFTNAYTRPASLGVDRWLTMLAVFCQGRLPACVIDVGTALTMDLISSEGNHKGGYVLPGPKLMQSALTKGTQLIDLDHFQTPETCPGTSTETSVNAGIWITLLGAVHLVLESHPSYFPILTGGHAKNLTTLGLKAEHQPDLLFEGLQIWVKERLDWPAR